MTNSQGAPTRNSNASSHGLYSTTPARRVTVLAGASHDELAKFTTDLADGALWISEHLADRKNAWLFTRQVVLYASVATELYQLAAELQGEVGIKPASLGNLDPQRFEGLMQKHAAALALILSQCVSAYQYIKDREEVAGIGLIDIEGKVNPILDVFAGHLRSAKRLILQMAANRAWELKGTDSDEDLAERLMRIIDEERKK